MPAWRWLPAIRTGKMTSCLSMTLSENRFPLFRIMLSSHRFDSMTPQKPLATRAQITPAGLMFLAITSIGWGFNWPVTKYLLGELPPLTMRGSTGVVGAALLAGLAILSGQSLRVPRKMWLRLVLAALLNVACWMTLMGLALLWLPASEAALIAYTMPVWASILAWPILGERPNLLRVISLVMAFAGLAAIMGGNGFAASAEKMPGTIMALGGSLGFAVGTVLAKKLPLALPPLSAAAWQIGIGCLPVAIAGLLIEKSDVAALSNLGWILLVYATVVQFCVAYVSWFAALSRLPASVAAIGTMAVPVIGVVTAAVALHEPLGIGQIAALIFTLAGVVLATLLIHKQERRRI
jgi:drug/metabolite transporter (DMT)-like permease